MLFNRKTIHINESSSLSSEEDDFDLENEEVDDYDDNNKEMNLDYVQSISKILINKLSSIRAANRVSNPSTNLKQNGASIKGQVINNMNNINLIYMRDDTEKSSLANNKNFGKNNKL